LLGYDGVPGRAQLFLNSYIKLNSQGDRSPEYPFKKPANIKRVITIGDSQAWGYGVADNETIRSRLEVSLNSNQNQYQVINQGVSGYGTDQAFLKYLLKGARYDPDFVVLIVFDNDYSDNSTSQAWGCNKPCFYFENNELVLNNIPPKRQKGWSNNYLINPYATFIIDIFGIKFDLCELYTIKFFKSRHLPDFMLHTSPGSIMESLNRIFPKYIPAYNLQTQNTADGMSIMRAIIMKLNTILKNEHREFIVFFTPHFRDKPGIEPKAERYYAPLLPLLATNDITYIDFLDYIEENIKNFDYRAIERNLHLSSEYSLYAAEAISRKILN
jgi:hypothetical protein